MENIIEIDMLNYHFGSQQVINNLSLKVPKYSVYGFLGPNGAGKSTTIKLILGLLKSDEENIRVFGVNINSNRLEILKKVGNLIESPTLYQHLSAYENLSYLNCIFKLNKSRIEEVLKLVGLWENRHKKAKQFSMGMKQRLGIAMAIFHNPELIILDEPVNGLDPMGVFEIRKLLEKLASQGKTIFLSSHILSEMEKLCTHIGIINKGKMIYQGKTKDLMSQTSNNVLVQVEDQNKIQYLLDDEKFPIVEVHKNNIEYTIRNNREFNELICYLVENKIELIDIEKVSENLEDIFINLTAN